MKERRERMKEGEKEAANRQRLGGKECVKREEGDQILEDDKKF